MTSSVAGSLRARFTHPLTPLLAMTVLAVFSRRSEPMTWAVLGGLAGYALSGSV